MSPKLEKELEAAAKSDRSLAEVVAFLEQLRPTVANEAMEDRILEIADFVAGFCSPHMRIWEEA